DVYYLKIDNHLNLEKEINQISVFVTNGIFALKPAYTVIMATKDSNIVVL
ncbi:ribose 5-phosphate isomerase A, partial [Francisella tularensis subsp. holarctica]|nr:ribose 5-phosphate isomerase A [Francisella tularensis subsp. holarctica]